MPTLTGKAIIITGAAQGIGAVLAAALATEGALVAVSDVRDCSEVVDRITLAGGQAIGIGPTSAMMQLVRPLRRRRSMPTAASTGS